MEHRLFTLSAITLILMSAVPVNAQSPILRIGLLADIQYCDCETAGTRHYRLSLDKTTEAVKVLLDEKVDYTVLLGDLIDRDISSSRPVWDRLGPLEPGLVMVPGNHDFALGAGKEADCARKELRNCCPEVRNRGNVRMLFLNGMMNSIGAWPEGSRKQARGLAQLNAMKAAGAPNAQEWNGGLGNHQLKWIRKQVIRANRNNQSLILFCHLPALPGDVHSLWDTPQLLKILGMSQKTVLYLCGHKHSGGDDQVGNCRIINLKGMVEGTGTAYGLLEVFQDRWTVKGFGSQGSSQGEWK